MLLTNEPVEYLNIPVSLLRPSGPENLARSIERRDYVSRVRAIAALRRVGCVVEPRFIDMEGAPVSEEHAIALREEVEPAIRELADGRVEHARRTIAEIDAGRKTDEEQVDDLLEAVYRAHSRGERPRDVLDTFLDTFERWLTPDGVAKVDALFDRIDLDRAPESAGIVLLATTRLTRAHFQRRDAFIGRLKGWLLGRSGRTEMDVETILRGLRE